MNPKKESLTPLKDILSALLSDSKLPFNPQDATIWKIWDEVVGPAIARNAQPLWIDAGNGSFNAAGMLYAIFYLQPQRAVSAGIGRLESACSFGRSRPL